MGTATAAATEHEQELSVGGASHNQGEEAMKSDPTTYSSIRIVDSLYIYIRYWYSYRYKDEDIYIHI